MEKMTKEQQQQIRAQYKEYEETVYADYPEVKKFVRLKKRWLGFLIIFGLALAILNNVCTTMMTGTAGASILYTIGAAVAGFGVTLIFLLASMNPNWRFSLFLLLAGFGRIMSLYETVTKYYGIHTPGEVLKVYALSFAQLPFLTTLEILSWVYGLLLILTAAALVVPNRSRMLAVQSEELAEKIKSYMMNKEK